MKNIRDIAADHQDNMNYALRDAAVLSNIASVTSGAVVTSLHSEHDKNSQFSNVEKLNYGVDRTRAHAANPVISALHCAPASNDPQARTQDGVVLESQKYVTSPHTIHAPGAHKAFGPHALMNSSAEKQAKLDKTHPYPWSAATNMYAGNSTYSAGVYERSDALKPINSGEPGTETLATPEVADSGLSDRQENGRRMSASTNGEQPRQLLELPAAAKHEPVVSVPAGFSSFSRPPPDPYHSYYSKETNSRLPPHPQCYGNGYTRTQGSSLHEHPYDLAHQTTPATVNEGFYFGSGNCKNVHVFLKKIVVFHLFNIFAIVDQTTISNQLGYVA